MEKRLREISRFFVAPRREFAPAIRARASTHSVFHKYLHLSTAAAMLPEQARGSFRKPIKKPSEQVAAPPSTVLADCHADHDRKWGSSLASFSGARAGWVLLKDFKFCFDGVLDERDFD